MAIVRARREKSYLRLGVAGTPKSGKSFSSLRIATGLIAFRREHGELPGRPNQPGYGRILEIDTEKYSSRKYAKVSEDDNRSDAFDFDVNDLAAPYTPERYIEAILEGARDGYAVIIADQLSHGWDGVGGAHDIHKELIEQVESQRKTANSYTLWREPKSRNKALFEVINNLECDFIGTCRAKEKSRWDKERKEVVKVGIKANHDKEIEYEFDVWAMMSYDRSKREHYLTVQGMREGLSGHFVGQPFVNPDENLGRVFGEWLTFGIARTQVERGSLEPAIVGRITDMFKILRTKKIMSEPEILEKITVYGVGRVQDLDAKSANDLILELRRYVGSSRSSSAAPPPPPEQAPEPEPPVERMFWVTSTGDGSVVDEQVAQSDVQSNIDAGADPDAWQIIAVDDPDQSWKPASHYGFTAPHRPDTMEASAVTESSDDNISVNVRSNAVKPTPDPMTKDQIGDELMRQIDEQASKKSPQKTPAKGRGRK